jgi:glucose uptake protein GlcU
MTSKNKVFNDLQKWEKVVEVLLINPMGYCLYTIVFFLL